MFFPGGLLIIIITGTLLDVLPDIAKPLGVVAFLVLIAWPIFTIIVHLRHERKLKRHKTQRVSEPVSITQVRAASEGVAVHDPLHTFLTTVEHLILIIGLPVALLGGLGVFCLVTAGDNHSDQAFKTFAGIGSLGLLGGYLLILIGGRSSLTLRIIGIALAVFGFAGIFALASVLGQAGVTSAGDVVMAVASMVMVVAGGWLAFTGRNTLKRTS